MKNKTDKLYLFLIVLCGGLATLFSCSNDEETIDLPVVLMTEGDIAPTAITCDDILSAGGAVRHYTVKLDKAASVPLLCDVVVEESLVEEYNARNHTNYKVMPAFVYSLQGKNVIIKAGEQESNTLSVKFSSLYGLTSGEEYLLPIVTKVDETCVGQFSTNSQSVSYYSLNVDRELDYIPGLKMSTYSTAMYTTLNFPNNEIVTIDENTHTFEMLIYPYSWHTGTNYIGTWRGKDLNNGNEDFGGCELRATGATGTPSIGNRQCDLSAASGVVFPTNQWVRLTVTCDGTKTGQNKEVAYCLYVNGELKSSKAPTKRFGPTSSQRFKVGYSLSGIQLGYQSSSYYFDGLISEIRMWKKCLSESEVKENLRKVVSPSSAEMYGYWKVDEGAGNTLKDSSGNGRDLAFPAVSTVVWNAELNDLPLVGN